MPALAAIRSSGPIGDPSPALARRRRSVAILLVAALVGATAALISVFRIGLLPPTIEARHLQQGAAVTHAAVRLPPGERPFTPTAFETQSKRANLIANAMAGQPVLDRIGRLTEIDPERIAAVADVDENVPVAFVEPDGERHANQILTSHHPYRLEIQSRSTEPMLDVYAQAPTVGGATNLADASVKATNEYLRDLATRHGRAARPPVLLAQLGGARGGKLDPAAPLLIATLTFLVAFGIAFGLLALAAQIRREWVAAGAPESPPAERGSAPAPPGSREEDAWPHTTRILPWMIAGFIAILWLVPINAITMEASLPIDLKLDRMLLPAAMLAWLFSLAAGGPGAPRWRFTRVHAAVTPFVAVAFLSVVLNAAHLNQTLELELAIKKLTLLGAYFSIFLLVASVVRRAEVGAFMTLMLAFAVICAAGILWEYRFGSNLFYDWSAKLLPPIFHVTPVDTMGYDEIGRRAVIGPTDLSLEAVAMLSMALPIALVRFMQSARSRDRVLYGLGVCVLLGATVATYRKSALLAPVSVCLTLAYFRRRELLRLVPLGLVMIVSIPILAPNALGSIVDQLEPGQLGVSTVSDRVSDYDAVRPDLLSNLAFGRGFGSYDHTSYRILDNDVLTRVVESGLIGLIAFIMMFVLVVAIAAPIIRSRDGTDAPTALAVAAAAVGFLVLSVLFDIMSFPNAPYLFMVLAGMLAVVVGSRRDDPHSLPLTRIAGPWHDRPQLLSPGPDPAGPPGLRAQTEHVR